MIFERLRIANVSPAVLTFALASIASLAACTQPTAPDDGSVEVDTSELPGESVAAPTRYDWEDLRSCVNGCRVANRDCLKAMLPGPHDHCSDRFAECRIFCDADHGAQ